MDDYIEWSRNVRSFVIDSEGRIKCLEKWAVKVNIFCEVRKFSKCCLVGRFEGYFIFRSNKKCVGKSY